MVMVWHSWCLMHHHYTDVIMGTMTSQITSLTTVYSTVFSGADQRKHQSSASLAFVLGIHRGPVNSPHKWPVTRKMFPFDDVIMISMIFLGLSLQHSHTKLRVFCQLHVWPTPYRCPWHMKCDTVLYSCEIYQEVTVQCIQLLRLFWNTKVFSVYQLLGYL